MCTEPRQAYAAPQVPGTFHLSSPSATMPGASGGYVAEIHPTHAISAAGAQGGKQTESPVQRRAARSQGRRGDLDGARTRDRRVASDQFDTTYAAKYPKAVSKGRERLLASDDFPAEYRVHLRASSDRIRHSSPCAIVPATPAARSAAKASCGSCSNSAGSLKATGADSTASCILPRSSPACGSPIRPPPDRSHLYSRIGIAPAFASGEQDVYNFLTG